MAFAPVLPVGEATPEVTDVITTEDDADDLVADEEGAATLDDAAVVADSELLIATDEDETGAELAEVGAVDDEAGRAAHAAAAADWTATKYISEI